jgi:secernin
LVLETAGREWATEPVTGRARSISNGLTIAGFAERHTDRLKSRVAACAVRRGITELAARHAEGPDALMRVLRGHGSGPAPVYSRLNGAMSAPCMHAGGLVTSSQTTASWVADLRSAPRHWVTGTSAPCTSLFKPMRVEEPLDLGSRPDDVADGSTLWWRHEALHRLAVRDLTASLARFAHERDRTERAWLESPPSGAEAFAIGRRLEATWTADLVGAALPDRRPHHVRRYWARQDRLAHREAGSRADPSDRATTGAAR